MPKTTSKNQIDNNIVAGTGKTTEEVWAQQVDATSVLAVKADSTVEYGGIEILVQTDITDMVESTDYNTIEIITQVAYDELTPALATTLYIITV